MDNKIFETRRRTILKSLLWRFIGIFWTWGGAYIIISMLPENYKNALTIATLVTAWHHSTRMIMYYFYERIWTSINWGIVHSDKYKLSISTSKKAIWTIGVIGSIALIFWLLFQVTPDIKKDQKKAIENKVVSEMSVK